MAFQILSLSGGGFLGLYTIALLEKIEQHAGRPIAECFDLIAGTSVGGIIALGLASGCPAEDIRKAFEKNGARIFSDRSAPKGALAIARDITRYLGKPKYDGAALRETIEVIVGADSKIGELNHPVIIPAVNLTKGEPQIFKTPHHPHFKRDLHLKIVDVAMATSAAPTYFPIAQIGDELFADGGVYLNAPDLAALHEAEYFFNIPSTDISMLSIGTTTSKFSFSHTAGRDLGIAGWVKGERLLRTSLSAQQACTEFMMRHKLNKRYLRLDEQQSPEQEKDLALDVATQAAQGTIRGLAEATFRKAINDSTLNDMLKHQCNPPVFYNPTTGQPLPNRS